MSRASASSEPVNEFKPQPVNIAGGGLVNYYIVEVKHPQRNVSPYTAECEDLIEALELSFDEANIFKEIWRTARGRQGEGKDGNNTLRATEKMVHYANRLFKRAKRNSQQNP